MSFGPVITNRGMGIPQSLTPPPGQHDPQVLGRVVIGRGPAVVHAPGSTKSLGPPKWS